MGKDEETEEPQDDDKNVVSQEGDKTIGDENLGDKAFWSGTDNSKLEQEDNKQEEGLVQDALAEEEEEDAPRQEEATLRL